MTPFIIETERGRLILNRVMDKGSLTLEINGSGVTQFLSQEELMELARWSFSEARRIKRG